MQDLRRIAAVLILLLCVRLDADTIRVTTWNLQWFPSGSPTLATPEIEAQRIKDAANVLVGINPDVILLQEVRNDAVCRELAKAMLPAHYEVLVCSAFKDSFGGVLSMQQVAILAKQSADGAWADVWKCKGTVDPPRGYAFAVIPFGKEQVGFYSLHLKSNLVLGDADRQNQLNILKRELSAEQVIQHTVQMRKDYPKLMSFVVGGDFNTNRDQDLFVSERTLAIFEQASFFDPSRKLPLSSRVTHPGSGKYPDATFDYLLTNGLKQKGEIQILPATTSDHRPVTVELELPQ